MTTTTFRDSVSAVVDALEIGSFRRVSWLGRDLDELGLLPDDLAGEALRSFISGLLYQSYYVYGAPRDDVAVVDRQSPTLSRSSRFLDRLLTSNRGTREWSLDCTVDRSATGRTTVDVWGIRFAVPDDVHRGDGTLSIRMPGVLAMNSPGYVMFFGDAGPTRADGRSVRLYWNVVASGAPSLVSALTETLNEAAVPFQLKVRHADRPWTDRADPAVLYLDHTDLTRSWDRIAAVGADLRSSLRPYTPALTRTLAPGLGFAEDPGGRASFGTTVCDILADGLVDAHRNGETASAHRIDRVERAFRRAGRRLSSPYLEPGSTEPRLTPSGKRHRFRRDDAPRPRDWLAVAENLGHRIADQALWHGERCTWLQPAVDPDDHAIVPATPEVYHGLAGIGALFAQLFRVTGDAGFARTAYGALLQAADSADRLPDLGLYAGSPGVGLALALSGRALDDERLFRRGAALARDRARACLRERRADRFDLVYGVAGTVVALVRLHELGADGAADLALRLGRHLVARAVRHDTGCHWPEGGEAGLTGMAHGGSGPVWALAELAGLTGDETFVHCATRASAYEAGHVDESTGNWPDIRGGTRRDRYDWCYGAPGILLSRLRWSDVTRSPRAAAETHRALSATRAAAAAFPRYGYGVCLCHGAAGLADILSLVPEPLARADDHRSRSALLAAGADAFGDTGPWQDGCGLMLGAAGVAWSALRAHDATVPSPLSWTGDPGPGPAVPAGQDRSAAS